MDAICFSWNAGIYRRVYMAPKLRRCISSKLFEFSLCIS
jgi:hypothetical protein